MKGGALTPEQEKLFRMLSKLLAWGSLGYFSWCTVMPVVEIILALLAASKVSYITMAFYELLWANLVSTMASISTVAASAGSVALEGLNLLAKTGNTCAAAHAVLRLANPLYKFFLGNIRRIVEVMENPMHLNQKIRELSTAGTQLVTTFLADYKTLGGHAIVGLDITADATSKLYARLGLVFRELEDKVKTTVPTLISEPEKSAGRENMAWVKSYEELIFQILSKVVEGGEYGSSKYSKAKAVASMCAQGTYGAAVYAKGWVSYFFECMNAQMERHLEDFVITRKRARSPLPSPPPPSAATIESLAMRMVTNTVPVDRASEQRYELALERSPEPEQAAEVVELVRGITPEPRQVREAFRTFSTCPRMQSAPPVMGVVAAHTPTLRKRFGSEIPSVLSGSPIAPRRRSVLPTIEQSPSISPADDEEAQARKKRKGGRKQRTHKHTRSKRRRTHKW